MKAQIRLAESGYSFYYSDLTTVQALMQQIKRDFKIQIQDQKIIMKSGQTVKSSINFSSIQQCMKKTIQTSNPNISNYQNINNEINEINEIECLYIYNQKQLLKPIESKIYSDEYYIKKMKQKFKQMSPLGESSYELKQFTERISNRNIQVNLQNINKKLKTPIQNIVTRYSKILQNINERKYLKLQIQSLLDLIQNQDKARKLLIRNVQFQYQKKTKKRFINLIQKINKQKQYVGEQLLKQNSGFFSSNKQINVSESLSQLFSDRQNLQKKVDNFYTKLKQDKTLVVKKKFKQEQKLTIQIDRKSTQNQKQYQEWIKNIKILIEQLSEQIIKINQFILKNKQKENKEIYKNLLLIHQKIQFLQNKFKQNKDNFIQMFIQLNKIIDRSQSVHIKVVFQIYVNLIRKVDDIDNDIKRLQKEYQNYKQNKNQQVLVSQFCQSKNMNLQKKNIKSPKKNQFQNQEQVNIPKISSPNRNKISKNNINKVNNNNLQLKQNYKIAIKQNKQLARRIKFNKKLQSLIKYCSILCEKQQQNRRNFRNSKQFQQNKMDILMNFNVPNIQIDYNETTDIQLTQIYLKYSRNQKNQILSIQDIWEQQIIQTVNQVNSKLTLYLASKSNPTQRQKSIQKILSLLSQIFYKMMNKKIQKNKQILKQQIIKQIAQNYQNQIKRLSQDKQQLTQKLWHLQQQLQSEDQTTKIKLIDNLQRIKLIQKKQIQLANINQNLQDQNIRLNQQIKLLQDKLHSYQDQMDQITQKLTIIQHSNNQEIEQLKHHLKGQKQLNNNLNKQLKQLNNKINFMQKKLITQIQSNQTLYKQIIQLSNQKQFYQKQFAELKIILSNKQIQIIKLQNKIQDIEKISTKINKQQFGQNQHENNQNECKCGLHDQVIQLKSQNQNLLLQIQHLQKQIKMIAFKQMQQVQTQTEQLDNNKYHNNCITNQITTKPINFTQNNWSMQNVVSQYYFPTQVQQWSSLLGKCVPITIGKTIEQGMYHIFLPFSHNIYIGVTVNEDIKNYTNYQQYLHNYEATQNINKESVYILDLKQFSFKANQMLTECSLVLVVKVQKKQQNLNSKSIIVKGKIQYALGFEDQDMLLKNYAPFLDQ